MFLLWGLRGGGRTGRILVAARLAIIVLFILAVFVFHPHGTALDILQVVRLVLLVALVGSSWFVRRRVARRPETPTDSEPETAP
ncbi:MAG TPA: hypothetical protein VFB25_13315 [Gaiellaceae bacterium]|nr:hypothetical protein [Gaiellaceae bacterium]